MDAQIKVEPGTEEIKLETEDPVVEEEQEEQHESQEEQEQPPETDQPPEGDQEKTAEEGGSEEEQEDEDEEDDEDDIKVTIEDSGPDYNLRAKQRQPQPAKPVAAIDLDAQQPILDVDLNTIEDKPWRKPGADISDYFNYGFDEETWRLYCEKQKKMKNTVNELSATNETTFKIPVMPTNDHSKYSPVRMIPTIVSTVHEPKYNPWLGGGTGQGQMNNQPGMQVGPSSMQQQGLLLGSQSSIDHGIEMDHGRVHDRMDRVPHSNMLSDRMTDRLLVDRHRDMDRERDRDRSGDRDRLLERERDMEMQDRHRDVRDRDRRSDRERDVRDGRNSDLRYRIDKLKEETREHLKPYSSSSTTEKTSSSSSSSRRDRESSSSKRSRDSDKTTRDRDRESSSKSKRDRDRSPHREISSKKRERESSREREKNKRRKPR